MIVIARHRSFTGTRRLGSTRWTQIAGFLLLKGNQLESGKKLVFTKKEEEMGGTAKLYHIRLFNY